MLLTVLICTKNRAPLLRQTLQGLSKIETPADLAWDVLVVDNASTDDTADLLKSLTSKTTFPFRWVTEPTAGLSAARNRAMAECRADYALFTDDDVQVEPDWIV